MILPCDYDEEHLLLRLQYLFLQFTYPLGITWFMILLRCGSLKTAISVLHFANPFCITWLMMILLRDLDEKHLLCYVISGEHLVLGCKICFLLFSN